MGDETVDVQVIAAKVDAGFAFMRERFADTSERLERIEDQVRETNGRVTRHDEQLKSVREALRERAEAMKNDGESGTIRRKDIQWWLWIAGGSIGGTIAILRLLGRL